MTTIKVGSIEHPDGGSNSVSVGGTGAIKVPAGTTAQRPATGVNGMIRYNTTTNSVEEYRDGNWAASSQVFTATGGTVTTSGNYTIHTFTSSGTFEVTSGTGSVEYLIVAGGGGGGGSVADAWSPGGGGAGGMRTGTVTASTGSYTITVGNGGAAGTG